MRSAGFFAILFLKYAGDRTKIFYYGTNVFEIHTASMSLVFNLLNISIFVIRTDAS